MPKPLEIDRELVRALAYQGFNARQIAVKVQVKPATVRSWLHRMGISRAVAQVRQTLATDMQQNSLASHAANEFAQRSQNIRNKLSAELERQTVLLEEEPATKFSDLRNSTQGEGRTSVVKKLAETADKVCGWSEEHGQSPINMLFLEQEQALVLEIPPVIFPEAAVKVAITAL